MMHKTAEQHGLLPVQSINRRISLHLLFAASVTGLTSVAFVTFVGVWHVLSPVERNYRGEPMASGHPYIPQTISDMVRSPSSSTGLCFFTMGFISALCTLFSFYPYYLPNVYIGEAVNTGGISWTALRTYVPPVGRMITVSVRAPARKVDVRDDIAANIHLLGWIFVAFGYVIFEWHALFISTVVQIPTKLERNLRKLNLACALASGINLVAAQFVLTHVTRHFHTCCRDVWRVPTVEDVSYANDLGHPGLAAIAARAHDLGENVLLDTASGTVLAIKIWELISEVLAAFFIIFHIFLIWLFAAKRDCETAKEVSESASGYRSIEAA